MRGQKFAWIFMYSLKDWSSTYSRSRLENQLFTLGLPFVSDIEVERPKQARVTAHVSGVVELEVDRRKNQPAKFLNALVLPAWHHCGALALPPQLAMWPWKFHACKFSTRHSTSTYDVSHKDDRWFASSLVSWPFPDYDQFIIDDPGLRSWIKPVLFF